MEIELRTAVAADIPRIREISAQIWDGDDFAGHLITHWLDDPHGEVTVTLLEGAVVGFARFYWLLPGYAWFEALRTDPSQRLRGAAKAITRYFLEKARTEGAERVGLSTYLSSLASIHIIETHGFNRVAEFIFCVAPHQAPVYAQAAPSSRAVEVSSAEALPFVRQSTFWRLARGHLPHGWKFYPFERAPQHWLARMQYRFGLRDAQGRLTALLCMGDPNREANEQSINFLEGDAEGMAELLRHALHLARDNRWLGMMLPNSEGQIPPVLNVAQQLGFSSWNDYQADVYVYEQALPTGGQP